MGKVEYTIEASFSFTSKGIVVMKKKVIVVIGLLLSLIGCGNTPTTAIDKETTVELSKEELASIENDFNEYQPNFYIEYLSSEFDTESEIKDIEETIEFIKDDPSEIKSLCGKYKCVSGTKEGDLYKVHVEVVEGDNWSEVVFPSRDVTFKKENDSYKFVSNIFDWASGSNLDAAYEVDMPELKGTTNFYVYDNLEDFPNESFIYAVNNGKKFDRLLLHEYTDDNEIINDIYKVSDMEAYDYNADGTTDLIIVGTDHKGEDNVLIFHYETGDESMEGYFYEDSELSESLAQSVDEITMENIKKALDSMQ